MNTERFDQLRNLWATGVREPFVIGKAAFGLDGL
jgi:hypothetical protein